MRRTFRRLLETSFSSSRRVLRRVFPPAVIWLDGQTSPATSHRPSAAGGDWNTASNEVGSDNPSDERIPTASDDAVVGLAGIGVTASASGSVKSSSSEKPRGPILYRGSTRGLPHDPRGPRVTMFSLRQRNSTLRKSPSRKRRGRWKPCLHCLEQRALLTTIIDLGILAGYYNAPSYARGINDGGEVVGLGGPTDGFLYSDGAMTALGTLADAAFPEGINDSGQVVGGSDTPTYTEHAFLYSDGAMTDLGTLPGGYFSEADGINDSGQVVGVSATADDGPDHAFLYSGGSMIDLGTLPGGYQSFADGINDSGQVVGGSDIADGYEHAFLYSGGSMTDLGTLGGPYSEANGINDSGEVVGVADTALGSSHAFHAFLYSGGSMTDMETGTLFSGNSYADGINDEGQVVGYAETAAGYDAFLYSAKFGMVDLNSLLPPNSGWDLTEATAVNDNGQIVGNGIHNGATRAFLLDLRGSAFTVTRTDDALIPGTKFPVPGTLRDAIEQSNIAPGPNTITFDIPGTGAQTISPQAPLPAITSPVTIDGGTLGSVIINGSGVTGPGLVLNTADNVIENLEVTGFGGDGIDVYSSGNDIQDDIISGNSGIGVYLDGPGASGNAIERCGIGTDLAKTAAMGNGGAGVGIASGASGNWIGVNATDGPENADQGNVIAGNSSIGVQIQGDGTTGNVVAGNLIGLNVDSEGNVIDGLGDGFAGVVLTNGASGNWIGVNGAAGPGTENALQANVISGSYIGVAIYSTGTTGNVVAGNLIGTDPTGTVAVPNQGYSSPLSYGVVIAVGASSNLIGTSGQDGATADALERNVISGVNQWGVYIYGQGFATTGNVVAGNDIGTTASGNAPLGNGGGVAILLGASNNWIGVDSVYGPGDADQRNVIPGNSQQGVVISGSGTSGNVVAGNYIGTNAAGTAAVGNGGAGISISSSSNTIGGTAAGAGNLISGNTVDAVYISGADNLVEGNRMGTNAAGTAAVGNGGAGVSTTSSGNTIGGTTAGAGNLMSGNSFGVFVFMATGTDNLVEGNLIGTDASGSSAVPNSAYGVAILGGATGNTVGGTAAGARNIVSGNGIVGVILTQAGTSSNVVEGNYIGTNLGGTAAVANAVYGVVINGGASGNLIGGSTAAARNIISGNGTYGIAIFDPGTNADLVEGNYIGTDAGGEVAVANGIGVNISGSASNNTIGGTSSGAGNLISGNGADGVDLDGATGNLVAGNLIGTNGDGNAALGNATAGVSIEDGSAGNTIGGTTAGARNVISGNTGDGVDISGYGTTQNLVAGDYIGLDIAGKRPVSNQGNGVSLSGGTFGNTISGVAATAPELISANNLLGVVITGDGTDENVVTGTYIGTDVSGSFPLGNSSGVNILDAASDNTIGGTSAGTGNVISASTSLSGVLLSGSSTSNNLIAGNDIGTDATGSFFLRNATDGVTILYASYNTIGGTTKAAANIISANSLNGIDLNGASHNLVVGNFIGTNSGGKADLGNANAGILIQNVASANTIGGTAKGAGNTIAFNGGNGVQVGANITDNSAGNAIEGNAIYSNVMPEINLGNESSPTGTPVGSPPSGPNNLQNAPMLTSAITGGSGTTITGTVSAAAATKFRIEFFSNPTGTSQGQKYLGSVNATTNGSGFASFSFSPSSAVAAGLNVTATATDPVGDTSEFSAAVTVQADVTSDLSVASGGFVYNRTTRQFSQTLTITNNSSNLVIYGPIELVLLSLKNATLVNQTGITLQGNPYITVLSSGGLGVGQSLTVALVFADPTLATITYTRQFLTDELGS